MAVPEQRQLLAQRIGVVQDAVQPPRLEAIGVAGVEHALTQTVEDALLIGRSASRGLRKRSTLAFGPSFSRAELGAGRAEAGAAMQVSDLGRVPGVLVGGLIRRPRAGSITMLGPLTLTGRGVTG